MYVVNPSGTSVSSYFPLPGGTAEAGSIVSSPVFGCSGDAVWVARVTAGSAAVAVAAMDGSGAVAVALNYNASAGGSQFGRYWELLNKLRL
jgi:hypothetical protein